MGWASGSDIGESLWLKIGKHIKPEKRQECARYLISLLEAHDCDTIDECEELLKAANFKRKYRDLE